MFDDIPRLQTPAGELVEALRHKQGQGSARALARTLRVPPQTLFDAMSGRTTFTVSLIAAIRSAYPDLRELTVRYIDSLRKEVAA